MPAYEQACLTLGCGFNSAGYLLSPQMHSPEHLSATRANESLAEESRSTDLASRKRSSGVVIDQTTARDQSLTAYLLLNTGLQLFPCEQAIT